MDLCGPKTFETESNKYQAARTELGGSSIKSLTWGTKMLMISVSALVLIDSKKCSKCLAHALTLHSAMFCANSILVLEICYCYFKSLKEKNTTFQQFHIPRTLCRRNQNDTKPPARKRRFWTLSTRQLFYKGSGTVWGKELHNGVVVLVINEHWEAAAPSQSPQGSWNFSNHGFAVVTEGLLCSEHKKESRFGNFEPR